MGPGIFRIAPPSARGRQRTTRRESVSTRSAHPDGERAWTRPEKTVGAVVIGGDYQGLGIIRSLGRRGVPICVIDDEHSIGRYSRYTDHAVKVTELRDEVQTVQTLMAVGRQLDLGGWVLYPTREETVAALSRNRAVLSELFRVPTPDWSVVRWAWDKRNTYWLGESLGIPVPRTWYPSDASDLAAVDGDPPFVIKPAVKEDFLYATKAKAWRADSRDELRALFDRASKLVRPGEVMIQELIPGDGRNQFACCAFVKDGEMLATMVARRRRQHPPQFGRASTFVETVEIPQLEDLSARFFDAIGYSGLAELEYKLDPRTDAFKLLDFNARTWGYHTLGYAAGVDFPYLQFADQIGAPVSLTRARPGTRWVRVVTDLPTAVAEIRRGRLGPRAFLRSIAGAHTEAVFSAIDPLPGLAELALIPYLAVKRGF
jgi:D-aspartate ligase